MGQCVFCISATHVLTSVLDVCHQYDVSEQQACMHCSHGLPCFLQPFFFCVYYRRAKKQGRPGNEARILCHDVGYYGPEIKIVHILVLSVQRRACTYLMCLILGWHFILAPKKASVFHLVASKSQHSNVSEAFSRNVGKSFPISKLHGIRELSFSFKCRRQLRNNYHNELS